MENRHTCINCKKEKSLGENGYCVNCYNQIKSEIIEKRATINHVEIPEKIKGKTWNGKIYNGIVYIGNEPTKITSDEFVQFLEFSIAGTITSPRLPKLELKGTYPSSHTLVFEDEKLKETIMTHSDWESQLFAWAKKINEVWGLAKAYFGNFCVFLIGTKSLAPRYQLILKNEKKIFNEQYALARWSLTVTLMRGALLEEPLKIFNHPLTVFDNTVDEEIQDLKDFI